MESKNLTKAQLSTVRGGNRWHCVVMAQIILPGETEEVIPPEDIEADTAGEAADIMHSRHPNATQINCTRA